MNPSKSRKALFNRPAWAAPRCAASDVQTNEDRDFFSRADATFDPHSIVDDRKTKTVSSHDDADRSVASRSDLTEDHGHASKRRRLSVDSEIDDIEDVTKAGNPKKEDSSSKASASPVVQIAAQSELLSRSHDEKPSKPAEDLVEHASSPDYADRGSPVFDESADAKSRDPSSSDQAKNIVTISKATTLPKSPRESKDVVLLDSGDDDNNDNNKDSDSIDNKAAIGSGEQSSASAKAIRDPNTKHPYDDYYEEDEALAKHIRQVRERMREEKARQESARHSQINQDADDAATTQGNPNDAHLDDKGSQRSKPVVDYLITSDIPGTEQLLVQRRADQRMKEVRRYWCQRNKFSDEDASGKIILTWQGQIWFDAMSAEDLGVGIEAEGQQARYEKQGYQGSDPYGGRIHLVAMTEAEFDARRAKRFMSEDQDEANEHSVETSSENKKASAQAEDAGEKNIRIILRSKSYEEQKLIVKPSVAISRIVSAFRKSCRVPDDRQVALIFEGDSLQPNSTVGQTGIEDMVIIDVHVR